MVVGYACMLRTNANLVCRIVGEVRPLALLVCSVHDLGGQQERRPLVVVVVELQAQVLRLLGGGERRRRRRSGGGL